MSKTKDALLNWDDLADAHEHELDAYLTPETLSEAEVSALERQSLGKELEELALRMQKTLDRVRYYGESIDADEFDFLHREVLRITKNFS
jgi:hypothetical protein